MREIVIQSAAPYSVRIGEGLLEKAGALSASLIQGRKAMIAAGEQVFSLYGAALRSSLEAAGFAVFDCVYPSGEEEKTPETLMAIIESLARAGFCRADAVFALGGGVTGDMAGLAAALYQRGLACILLPTTLLAAADASVGGKTAVNLSSGKNQMGVFSQPRLVLCDTGCFQSLPPEHWKNGWAEIIKTSFLREGKLQDLLADDEPEAYLEEIIALALQTKGSFAAEDERDCGRRRLLNFGHTVGHAIEHASAYCWSHGAAVAAGMAIITRAAYAKGLCGIDCVHTLEALLSRFALPARCDLEKNALLAAMRSDKKRQDEHVSIVVPRAYGRCEVLVLPLGELGDWLDLGL